MNDSPSDSDSKAQEHDTQASVQDYLDLLLSSATEKPEAQIEISDPVANKSNTEFTPKFDNANKASPNKQLLTEARDQKISYKRVALDKNTASDSPHVKRVDTNTSSIDSLQSGSAAQRLLLTDVQTFRPRDQRLPNNLSARDNEPLRRFRDPQPIALQLTLPTVRPEPQAPDSFDVNTESKVNTDSKPIENEQVEKFEEKVEKEFSASSQQVANQLAENAIPQWAENRFECLLFTVGGLTLAVPLSELGAIYPKTEALTPIFGQVDWLLGLLPTAETNIRVVNTAKVVMPERYVESMVERFEYVISINGVDWGLAVDDVSKSISLEPDNIRWSSKKGKRPWLAGTVIEHMCALLDVSELALMFSEEENRRI